MERRRITEEPNEETARERRRGGLRGGCERAAEGERKAGEAESEPSARAAVSSEWQEGEKERGRVREQSERRRRGEGERGGSGRGQGREATASRLLPARCQPRGSGSSGMSSQAYCSASGYSSSSRRATSVRERLPLVVTSNSFPAFEG